MKASFSWCWVCVSASAGSSALLKASSISPNPMKSLCGPTFRDTRDGSNQARDKLPMMEIKMHIIYEEVDGLIQASVAELPGAISLGNTVEEARQNLDEAIEMVLEGNRLLAEDVERARIRSEEIAFRAA